MAFKLRSGNKSSFKSMGSSPATQRETTEGMKNYLSRVEYTQDEHEALQQATDLYDAERNRKELEEEKAKENATKKPSLKKKKPPTKQIELALLRKRKGLGPKEIKGEDDQSYEAAVTRKEMGMTKEYPYYYKINGQNVSKDAYIKYKNKPGGDEPGKQTNDPDVYGKKANNHGRGKKTK